MLYMDESKTQKIDANIAQLDYLQGTGVLTTHRKHLAKEMFVFISTGGIGRKALVKLKQTIVGQVDSREVEKQTLFLAIDTANLELDDRVEKEELAVNEILKIPYVGAHDSIAPNKISPQLKRWVHEKLWRETGGDGNSSAFDGTGAGAIRQCGRVLFAQPTLQNELYQKLSNIPRKLAEMGHASSIKVMFLAGIAGGTGSGTILDLAFLTRHFLKGILGYAYATVRFSGYLFLPSACGNPSSPDARAKGNRNAYAALKEIDHYMTMSNRHEHFQMDYGTVNASNIDIGENVFDFCTLVEGVGSGGVFFRDNEEIPRQIVAESILNMICANNANVEEGGKEVFLVDSYFSNYPTQTEMAIEGHSDRTWPRDTNYIYSVIGFSSCVVPVDLLTVYVANKIFDQVFDSFKKADDADEDSARNFLSSCGLDVKSFHRKCDSGIINEEKLFKDIQAQADNEFKAYGPFYMTNLTKVASELIRQAPDDYMHEAENHIQKKFVDIFMSGRKTGWYQVYVLYDKAATYLEEQNQKLYQVYTYVVSTLRELLEKNAKLLTDTREYAEHFGKTFCWSPIDLTKGEQATKAVMDYLDDILDREEIEKKARKFMESLCSQKEAWTELEVPRDRGAARFDAAKAIRSFIDENLKRCINTTMEEFLVKAYSGQKDAPVFEIDSRSGREICSKQTKEAAQQILARLNDGASPLVQESGGYHLWESYSNIYLTIPSDCPWLYEAVSNIASEYGIKSGNIYKSSAKDRVVLCRLYAGIPAWALYWTAGAEEAYEGSNGTGPYTIGLHMDQGKEGTNWAGLPNLYPEKLWTEAQRRVRTRENNISDAIRENMQKARLLELLVRDRKEREYFHIFLLNGEYSAEGLFEMAELNTAKQYSFLQILQILADKGALSLFEISYSNMVMSTTDNLAGPELEEFYFELACRIIRRFYQKYKLLEKTVSVIEGLKEIVDSVTVPAGDLSLFIRSIKWEIIKYDSRRNIWKVKAGDEQKMGFALDSRIQQICAHYHGFRAFSELGQKMLDKIKHMVEKIEDEASDDQFDQADGRIADLKTSLKELRYADEEDVKPWGEKSPFAKSGNDSPWPMATLDFEEQVGGSEKARYIREFYSNLIDNI